jgi:hypothetical protein
MRHLTRPVSAFFLRFVLASVLYGWARSILHVFASGRPMHPENRALMLGVGVALAALFWLLYRRYRFVRQIALVMLGLAVLSLPSKNVSVTESM